jgi:hypothetical protein
MTLQVHVTSAAMSWNYYNNSEQIHSNREGIAQVISLLSTLHAYITLLVAITKDGRSETTRTSSLYVIKHSLPDVSHSHSQDSIDHRSFLALVSLVTNNRCGQQSWWTSSTVCGERLVCHHIYIYIYMYIHTHEGLNYQLCTKYSW